MKSRVKDEEVMNNKSSTVDDGDDELACVKCSRNVNVQRETKKLHRFTFAITFSDLI